MAEEHNPIRSEEITAGTPSASSANGALTEPETLLPDGPAPAPAPDGLGDYNFKRTWGQLILGWILAVVSFIVVGYFLAFVLTFVMAGFHPDGRVNRIVGFIAGLSTYFLFLKLDENMWLSRFFGLQTSPTHSPLRSVLYFFTFGPVMFLVHRRGLASSAEPALSTDPNAAPRSRPKERPHDTMREIAETVVFVVVLVLMLKTFIAEAFVIPTGSMASTLWGYQKVVECPQCGYRFPVNCSSESDPQSDQRPAAVVGCTCPNCRKVLEFIGVDEGPLYVVENKDNHEELWLIKSSNGQDPLLTIPSVLDSDGLPVRAPGSYSGGTFPVRACKLQPDSKTFLDGKEASADQLREALRGMREPPQCRARYRLSDSGPQPILDLDVATSGSPTLNFAAFDPSPNSGDRVLVAKFLYDSGFSGPARHDVVVFKFPDTPQKNFVALNYIKRLIGKPGETIGIHRGNLYVTDQLKYPDASGILNLNELRWATDEDQLNSPNKHSTEFDRSEPLRKYREELLKALDRANTQLKADINEPTGKNRLFTIIRKPPDAMLALSRIVYDNDHQAKDLTEAKVPPRWSAAEPWKAEDADRRFTHDGGNDLTWVRYRHLMPSEDRKSAKASLITNVMGYNSGQSGRNNSQSQDWVGDLMLECDLQVDGTAGEVWLELSKGVDRFQARFDLSSGECKLVRFQGTLKADVKDNRKQVLADVKESVLDTKPTKLKAGKHHVRFANYDQRLTLWVDDELPFGDGKEYDAPPLEGPTAENDLERPAGVGVRGGKVQVEHLRLWRDTYYTTNPNGQADVVLPDDDKEKAAFWSDPSSWERLRRLEKFRTMYVQPGHYLCMGDNSTQSSDGRDWGLVPDRLLLGRALVVYYPFKFPFWPLNNPENRVGPIH